MGGRALSLRRALLAVVAACALAEMGLVVIFASSARDVSLGLSLVVLAALVSAVLVPRAVAALTQAAERLLALARAEDWQQSLRAPALSGSGAVQAELAALRRRILERVEQSQRLREQAEEAEQYKVAFLRSVSHELRTPLNSIIGFADVLLSDLEGPLSADQRENLQVIGDEGRRLSDLFNEVIELATVVSGQLGLEPSAIDLSVVFEELAEQSRAACGERLVHLRLELPQRPATVVGDAERLRRMFGGLLRGALRACTGHELVLSLIAEPSGVRVDIRDPSRMLTPEEQSVLASGAGATPRKRGLDEGSRLSLSIFRQIAQLHGGELEVESGPGGTSLVVTLPWGRRE